MIYLVTDGCYSDYRVLCVCSTRELAEEAKKLYMADNDIEEYVLDGLPEHPPGMLFYSVRMNAQGDTEIVERSAASDESWNPSSSGYVAFRVWAYDDQHAVKIANERRAQLIANNEWTTNWEEWKEKYETTRTLST